MGAFTSVQSENLMGQNCFFFLQVLLEVYLNYYKYMAQYRQFILTDPCHSSCEAVALYPTMERVHNFAFLELHTVKYLQ